MSNIQSDATLNAISRLMVPQVTKNRARLLDVDSILLFGLLFTHFYTAYHHIPNHQSEP